MATGTSKSNTAAGNAKADELESNMAIAAALLVLFSTMLDARFSVGLSLGLIIAYAGYKYLKSKGKL